MLYIILSNVFIFQNVVSRGIPNPYNDMSLTFKDIAWLKKVSGLPVIVKGILSPDDARLAVEHGAAAILVSNHGGRQLDTVPATVTFYKWIILISNLFCLWQKNCSIFLEISKWIAGNMFNNKQTAYGYLYCFIMFNWKMLQVMMACNIVHSDNRNSNVMYLASSPFKSWFVCHYQNWRTFVAEPH